jgi:glucose-like phosphotransferase system IIB component
VPDVQERNSAGKIFGGEANITQVDACITRLRVTVRHLAAVDSDALQLNQRLDLLFFRFA